MSAGETSVKKEIDVGTRILYTEDCTTKPLKQSYTVTHLFQAVTCIERSPLSCTVIYNFT